MLQTLDIIFCVQIEALLMGFQIKNPDPSINLLENMLLCKIQNGLLFLIVSETKILEEKRMAWNKRGKNRLKVLSSY